MEGAGEEFAEVKEGEEEREGDGGDDGGGGDEALAGVAAGVGEAVGDASASVVSDEAAAVGEGVEFVAVVAFFGERGGGRIDTAAGRGVLDLGDGAVLEDVGGVGGDVEGGVPSVVDEGEGATGFLAAEAGGGDGGDAD